MVFKCQQDSFMKEFQSKVLVCKKVSDPEDIKNESGDKYEVILEDTILFPEGGGQPCDFGFLNDIPVKQVVRRADKAVHYVDKPLNVGDTVKQSINWDRRFDHMQQHSGQHLITAIIDREFKIQTVSWYLGEEVSYIEIETPSFTREQIQKVEDICNELIRSRKSVSVSVYSSESEKDLEKARSARGLPEDHVGDIRVINIEDVDSNMCCGTHVSNLSQLQVIKLLHTEKSKRKGNTLLYFLVGNRVLKRLTTCIKNEQLLTSLVKCNPSEHAEMVEKLQKNAKNLNKSLQTVLKELAACEADKLKKIVPLPKYYFLHKKEADPDFMNTFIRELGLNDILVFLSVGDEKTTGNIVLYGPEQAVGDLGDKIADILEGKGSGKGNKYQAKVNKMVNHKKAEQLIVNYFK
ncbi:unnamed protein product [Acanthoscelides obtectus]|nr:unnamed protein product [Acanthoscelides obtectus]CAK1683140.1 Alanyl-tRNA editing protein Aarsd1 [Acanthoscelides obtectus]